MSVIEIHTRVTKRSLMNRDKSTLADRVLELMEHIDRERELRKAAEERAEVAEKALVALTPDGSEFYRRDPDRFAAKEFRVDVPACVAWIREDRQRKRRALVDSVVRDRGETSGGGMDFGGALACLKAGFKVRRPSFPDGQYLALLPEFDDLFIGQPNGSLDPWSIELEQVQLFATDWQLVEA